MLPEAAEGLKLVQCFELLGLHETDSGWETSRT